MNKGIKLVADLKGKRYRFSFKNTTIIEILDEMGVKFRSHIVELALTDWVGTKQGQDLVDFLLLRSGRGPRSAACQQRDSKMPNETCGIEHVDNGSQVVVDDLRGGFK